MTKLRTRPAAVAAFFLALALPGLDVQADEISHQTDPFGRKLSELSAEWWQLVTSLPTDINPLLDTTGERCAIGQRGSIWFLFGTFAGSATRTCTVPENKALFFPVINSIDLNVTNQTVQELRAELEPCFDAVNQLSAEVDGTPLRILQRKNRVRSVPFEVTLPPGNLFGLAPAVYSPAVDDGFYVLLEPLELGPHTLRFSGTMPPNVPGCINSGGVSVDVKYHLNVVAVQLDERNAGHGRHRDR